MKILITGGSGFVGTHLSNYLSKKGHAITIFDQKKPKELSNNQKFIKGTLFDKKL